MAGPWMLWIIGIAAVIMALLFIHDPPYIKRGEGGVDYWGIGYLALGIGANALSLGPQLPGLRADLTITSAGMIDIPVSFMNPPL